MDSRRIEMGSERELAQILRLQEKSNPFAHSRGLFYISAHPGYLPESHYQIPVMFRHDFQSLCKDIRNPPVMDQFATWFRDQLQSLRDGDSSSLTTLQLVQLIRSGNREEFNTVINSWESTHYRSSEVWNQVLHAPPIENLPLLGIEWNGTDNVFHYFLSALISGQPALHTISGELVRHKLNRTVWWTLSYSVPALLFGWGLVYIFVLWFYDRSDWLNRIDRWTLLLYSFPTFVLASLALVFFTSHRYGWISHLFPFPVFLETNVNGLWDIYRHHGPQLILPMILFAISPMLLFYRVFHEKIREIRTLQPSVRYLRHIGVSAMDFRIRYLSRYILVATWAVLSNLFVAVLGGSLIIEWIFNIPGLGRFMYESIVDYDVTSTVYLIFIFTIVQQLGHVLIDFLIDYFYSPDLQRTGLL